MDDLMDNTQLDTPRSGLQASKGGCQNGPKSCQPSKGKFAGIESGSQEVGSKEFPEVPLSWIRSVLEVD